ncbi:hypothetical protein HYFRA_00012154 [Hymenoscyphus fraxineus]|uniref:Glucose-methanol-choline oxidoreductase N-terminal domain-containing protein n=1 Tax=Hymenoscyphus fraxineus TaxID=746836 RepID=A0A9N9L784_9HELO|nr:hypothetical protein HYFRA_00012154 [Hymenoscyphus fraxineus]
MVYTLYDGSIVVLQGILGTLSHILHQAEKQPDADKILEARLHEEMLPLPEQVRIATQYSENLVARLSGRKPVEFSEKLVTFADFYKRIETVAKSLREADKDVVNLHAEVTELTAMGPAKPVEMSGAIRGFTAVQGHITVVGGGTAGLTIAARLAETASVAVIEAGGFYDTDNGNFSIVPFNSLGMGIISSAEDYPPQPLIDWGLISVPQPRFGNRRFHYAQGKTLGGSSGINIMGYHRGTTGTYQRWADIVEDQSYTFDNLLPYFQRSCHFTPPNLEKRNSANATPEYDPSAFSTTGGPLQVSYVNFVDPMVTWGDKMLQEIGLKISPTGFNSGILSGYTGYATSTIDPRDATRSSSYTSFLEKAIEETEIIVYAHTQAMRITFDSNKKATGVVVSTQGLEYTISANKEVIVSAGVFHTPQLLMVSGIGPQAVLEFQNITVISALEGVGQNLWDPVFFLTTNRVNTPTGSTLINGPDALRVLKDYTHNASGPYSAAGGHFAFEKIPANLRNNFTKETQDILSELPDDWPEVEYSVAAGAGQNNTVMGTFGATILAPLSRGNVSIRSSSMLDQPLINMNRLSHPADMEVLIAAFKRGRQVWNTPAAKAVKIGEEIIPGAAVQSDEQIATYIRDNLLHICHASATCSMGSRDDPMAVLDSKAKVYGVDGLRVVDASAFPFAIPGHPQASVYMLAEKIADEIKKGQ